MVEFRHERTAVVPETARRNSMCALCIVSRTVTARDRMTSTLLAGDGGKAAFQEYEKGLLYS
eukprot:scaffold23715_cov43-Prasinocladus_malaysianus.AAC.3